ncbi:MAG: hypothetical protein HEQ29_15085 [Dolichospermum sp. LBC05a]|nr:MAG: hypothetical protein HEQ29_15085 [Dolichospermum sp. LBC05a]
MGNYAYVADGLSGLQIIDISNPTTPTLKGNYDTSGYALGVQVVGNYAYVADNASGLQIIDISNPTTPTLKGNYDTSGYALGVQVVGNYAYVADESSGLQIIDISNPTTPTLKGNYNTSGEAWGVQVVGNYAYVADGEGGLKIINVSEFTNQAPTNITLSNSNIAENQVIGTVVGNFTTTDPDANNTFTYSLVAGTGDTNNSVFTITSNQLKTNSVFDYETKNSYSVRVKTTDQGGLSYEKELTIGVNDLNEITGNPSINNGRTPIVGTAAADYIIGGPGAKTISGGLGNDFFVFNDLRDVGQRITDFTVGTDKIVLTQLLSNINYNGADPIADQYMRFVAGTGSNIGSTFLQIDRDGISGSAIFKNFLQVDNITTTQLNNVNNFVF